MTQEGSGLVEEQAPALPHHAWLFFGRCWRRHLEVVTIESDAKEIVLVASLKSGTRVRRCYSGADFNLFFIGRPTNEARSARVR